MNIRTIRVALVLLSALWSAQSFAAIPPCGRVPPAILEAVRQLNNCLTTQAAIANCDGTQNTLNVSVFYPRNQSLPNSGPGATYYQAPVVIYPRQGPGNNRLVFLRSDSAENGRVLNRYYIANQHERYCKL